MGPSGPIHPIRQFCALAQPLNALGLTDRFQDLRNSSGSLAMLSGGD
jgi:hypothetical protein